MATNCPSLPLLKSALSVTKKNPLRNSTRQAIKNRDTDQIARMGTRTDVRHVIRSIGTLIKTGYVNIARSGMLRTEMRKRYACMKATCADVKRYFLAIALITRLMR